MSEGHTFYGSPRTGPGSGGRFAGLVVVLLVVFLGLAIVKPWGGPAAPTVTPGPSLTHPRSPAASIPTTGPGVPSAEAAAAATPAPLPVAFIMPAPPPARASWSALRWRRLAPDDPLTLVTSVIRWRAGFIALGWEAERPATAVWTSADGTHWVPLPFDTSTTFWPGVAILGVADLPTGLVALTEVLEFCGAPCRATYILPIVAWTSPDGLRWTPHTLPPEWLASPPGIAPLIAAGPGGLVVASSGAAARIATSPDGSHWQLLPAGTFPANLELNELRGSATGYVAAGRWMPGDGPGVAASLWSPDGRDWSHPPSLLPTSPSFTAGVGSTVDTLIGGRDGLIAVGHAVNTPGAALWWQSADGREWRALPGYPPLGPWSPSGAATRSGPHGTLAVDGERMVAVRGGTDAAVWLSTDGSSWRPLAMSGDLPSEQATQATLLPGGVLLSDSSTTWFGQAVVP